LRRVRARIEPGAIIILHDGGWRLGVDRSQTLEAVDILTDELLADGYEFMTMSGLLESTSV
jgi:peptidoglycan/xylan/chitin deacetylase (PgdA/CDA1 family)